MKKLIEYVLRNRRAIIFIVFILMALGIYSLFSLSQAVFPKVVFPQIVIKIDRGFAPLKDMEVNVTKPIEDAMQTVAGVRSIRSKTRRGSAEIQLTFDWKTNLGQAYQSVLAKASEVKSILPRDAAITITRMTTSTYPVAGYSVYSDIFSLKTMRDIALHTIKPQLEGIKGVDKIEVIGGVGPEFKVVLKPEKLAQYHLNPLNVIDMIKKSNNVDFLGTITQEYRLFLGFANYQVGGKNDIENILLGYNKGLPIYVKQVATVEETTTELVRITSTNGHPAVLFNVIKHPNANVIAVSKRVDQRLAQIQKHLPYGMKISKWYDLSEFVKKSIRGVALNILEGVLIISLIIFLFLRRLRTSLPIIIIMPLTVILSFLIIKLVGFTLNIMTLGGLTAAIGILVDNASVVVENIVRHRDEGEIKQNAIINGTSEIIPPLISATLTTVAVFVPLVMLSGVSGFFFKASSATMAIALSLSLLLAIFVTPIITYYILGEKGAKTNKTIENRLIQRVYKKVLGFTLQHSGFIILISVMLAGGAVYVYMHLSTGFLPTWDEGTFIMDLDTKPGTSLSEMNRIVNGVEKVIQTVPEIKTYSRQTGDEAVRPNQAHFFMHPQSLKGQKPLSVFEVMNKLEKKLAKAFPDLNVDLHQILPDRFHDLIGRQNTVIIKLFGNNLSDLNTAYNILKPKLEKISTIAKVKGRIPETQPEFFITFKKYRLAKLGISMSDVSSQIKTILWGTKATEVVQGIKPVGVRVIYPNKYHKYIENLRTVPIFTNDGRFFPLSSIADITVKDVPGKVYHENGSPVLNIDVKTKTSDLRGNVDAIQKVINRVTLPTGVTVRLGGDWSNQLRSFRELVFVLSLAAILVFALLLFEFKSYRVSLIIFISTLFSLSFVIFGLAITNTSFNVSTFMGLITSLGIVVNNGILIMDFVERYKKQGVSVQERLIRAGTIRIRPVMITSITTIGGFLPMALRLGGGGEMLQPFAVAVISGLVGSMFFSLIVIPNMYNVFKGRERNVEDQEVIT